MNTHYQQIAQLRNKNMLAIQESILVLLTAVFIALLLPQVLIRFVYANQNLLEEPMALQYLSPILLAVGLLQVVFTFIGNFKRTRQIATLEQELASSETNRLQIDETEIQELEKIIEQSLSSKSKKTPVKKSTTTSKRPAKRTTK